jgi:hypothetical protein
VRTAALSVAESQLCPVSPTERLRSKFAGANKNSRANHGYANEPVKVSTQQGRATTKTGIGLPKKARERWADSSSGDKNLQLHWATGFNERLQFTNRRDWNDDGRTKEGREEKVEWLILVNACLVQGFKGVPAKGVRFGSTTKFAGTQAATSLHAKCTILRSGEGKQASERRRAESVASDDHRSTRIPAFFVSHLFCFSSLTLWSTPATLTRSKPQPRHAAFAFSASLSRSRTLIWPVWVCTAHYRTPETSHCMSGLRCAS